MGFYDRMQQRLSGGNTFADRMAQRLEQSESPQVGVTLEGLDAERAAEEQRADAARFKPWSGPAQIPLEQTSQAGDPQWSGGSNASDAAFAAAGGVMTGLGMNPRDTLGDQAGGRVQLAHERRPWVSGGAQVVGEAVTQALLGLGPIAGGALSGFGNTEGSLNDKATGTVLGGAFGKIGNVAVGKLSSLLGRGAAAAEREAMNQGLMHSGATRGDLKRLDDLGGREKFAEGAQRLGLTGRPGKVMDRATAVDKAANAERAAIEQAADVDALAVDPAAVRGNMVGRVAAQFPGITPAHNAANVAAGYVDNIAPEPGAGAPWRQLDKQRQYWGEKANFASGTPENQVRQQMHGAVNEELGDALSLQTPGAGDRWRQLGRDQQVAKELGSIATAGADRAREWGVGDALAVGGGGALGALLGGYSSIPAAAATLAAKRGLQSNQHLLMQGGSKLGSLLARGGQGFADNVAQPALGSLGGQLGAAANPRLDQSALDMLRAGGQDLGPYKSQFAEAAGSPEPGAVSALVAELIQTDPVFRTQVLPQLRRIAGGP